jgi:hypothetical protein
LGVRTRLILGSANRRLNLAATVSLRGRDQNHHAEACDLPTPVYGWSIEDLDTPDLRRQRRRSRHSMGSRLCLGPHNLVGIEGPDVARSGRRAPNRGNVVEDPLWDRIADGGNPGCQGEVATQLSRPRRVLRMAGMGASPAIGVRLNRGTGLGREATAELGIKLLPTPPPGSGRLVVLRWRQSLAHGLRPDLREDALPQLDAGRQRESIAIDSIADQSGKRLSFFVG